MLASPRPARAMSRQKPLGVRPGVMSRRHIESETERESARGGEQHHVEKQEKKQKKTGQLLHKKEKIDTHTHNC